MTEDGGQTTEDGGQNNQSLAIADALSGDATAFPAAYQLERSLASLRYAAGRKIE